MKIYKSTMKLHLPGRIKLVNLQEKMMELENTVLSEISQAQTNTTSHLSFMDLCIYFFAHV